MAEQQQIHIYVPAELWYAIKGKAILDGYTTHGISGVVRRALARELGNPSSDDYQKYVEAGKEASVIIGEKTVRVLGEDSAPESPAPIPRRESLLRRLTQGGG